MREFRFYRLILCIVLCTVSFPLVSAQSKWTVPNLHFLDWQRETIGSGKTPLSITEREALARITGPDIRGCLSDPGPADPTTFEGNFGNLRVRRVLLNSAGLHGLVVQASGVCMCGATGNCDFWLIAERSSGFEVVLHAIGIETFEVTNTTSNGYFDMVLGSHDSAMASFLQKFRFDGKRYRRVGCAELDYVDYITMKALKNPKLSPTFCGE